MTEKAKRLQPTGETLRELFLKSGNLCAFPGCGHLMMDADGDFIGQLCHIEAAEEGGERFNSLMTNEQRRQSANLILMCYKHHKKTDDVVAYPVDKLKEMKRDHEARFSHPDRAILEHLRDWTEADEPSPARNLLKANRLLGWGNSSSELALSMVELNSYVDELRKVPIELRRLLGAIAKRAGKMVGTGVVSSKRGGMSILISDIRGAFKLHDDTIAERINELDSYRVAFIDELDTELGMQPAVRIPTLKSGWPIWEDIISFCEKAEVQLSAFTDDLDFSRLDD